MLLEPELSELPLGLSAPPDRRVAPRYRCRLAIPARARTPGGGAARLAWVCNASATAAGLLLDGAAAAGQPLTLWLLTVAGTPVELRGAVVHASPQADGRWLVGFAFDKPLAEGELEALL